MRTTKKNANLLLRAILSAAALVLLQTLPGHAQNMLPMQQAEVKARVVPNNPTPFPGDTISAAVFIDTRDLQGFDNRLAAYQAKLEWNEAVLQFVNFVPGTAPWNTPNVTTVQTNSGILEWNDFLAGGADPADFNILNVRLRVIGGPGDSSALDLSFSEMITSFSRNLLGLLEVADSSIVVKRRNTPPVLATIPDQIMMEGTSLTVPVTATDAESIILRLEARQFPTFVTLQDNGSGNGTITFTPPLGFAGIYSDMQVIVFDDGTPALSDTATFTLTVTPNTPPVLTAIEDQTMLEGTSRVLPVTATDAETMNLTLRAVNFPAFAQLQDNGNGNGTISLEPPLGSAGTYTDLTVIVFETEQPTLADTVSFNVSVRGMEPPPVLDRIPDTTMSEGNVLELPVRATKGSGTDDIVLAVNNLPAFGSFTDNHNGTGLIHFAPGFADAGIYPDIQVTAQDTSTPPLTDSFTFKLTVLNVNRPPVLEPINFDSFLIDEGTSFRIDLRATDPDNDSLRFSVQNLPRFGQLLDNGDGTGAVQFDPGSNDAGTYPQIEVVVTDNGVPNLSDSDSFDLTVQEVNEPLTCRVKITSPGDSAVVCDDTTQVCVEAQASGGVGPIKSDCKINGVPVVDQCALVPLTLGWNTLIANCTFTDSLGTECTSSDTIHVFAQVLQCALKITSPQDSTFICANSINVSAVDSVSGGHPPYESVCTINGDTVVSAGGVFGATVSLAPGYNSIIAACTFTDSLGCTVTCRDTVTVFSDPTPPTATFNFNNLPIITGEAVDEESGIAKVEIVEVNNRVVTINPFNAGDKRVTFSSDKIDPNQRSGFVLKITNRAGCEILADPVYLRLDPVGGQSEFSFNMLHTDRFLYVNNHGLPKIQVLINERELKLVANDEGVGYSGNTHFMPKEGQKLIDIASYLHEGENQVFVRCDATATGSADLLFADVQLGEIDNKELLPTAFALNQNYPNPFNPETRITFDIPANWAAAVTLRIFNMQGQLIRTLVDGVMTPGRHEAIWNGRNESGQPVATGMYFYQILSGEVKAVKKMMMTK